MSNASYVLQKYSRSYPTEDAARLVAQPTSADSEWQHFASPTLHLLSEVVGLNGPRRSARVRIVWAPGVQEPHPTAQGHVVLEDINLLAFPSALSLPTIDQKTQNQSIPLKVVYRDSVVGFRYLHPYVVPAGSPPTYRRFQISFTDPSTATQFVNSICQFCPCKASLPPAAALSRSLTAKLNDSAFALPFKRTNVTNNPPSSFLTPVQPASSQILATNTQVLDDNMRSRWPNLHPHVMESSSQIPPITPKCTHIPLQDSLIRTSSQHNLQTPSFNPLLVSSSSPSLSRAPPQFAAEGGDSSIHSSSLVAQPPHKEIRPRDAEALQSNREVVTHHPSQSTSAQSSSFAGPPSASQQMEQLQLTSVAPVENTTTSSLDPSITPSTSNLSVSSRELHNRNSGDISASSSHPRISLDFTKELRTVKELCDMPGEQLERLVGEVVRDPGFLPLLEKLDAMWKVKGFISRT